MTVSVGQTWTGGKLLRVRHVPNDFRQPFILTGYRSCRSSATTSILSALSSNNETLNIWTHLLAAGLFLGLSRHWLLDADPFTYPLQVYLLSVCLYMLVSCGAHLFNSMSERVHYLCFFCDYGAISLYSLAVGVMYDAYALPRCFVHSPLRRFYVPVCALSSLVCTVLACAARLVGFKLLRVMAFTLHYVYCSLPLMHRCLLYCEGHDDQDCQARAVRHHGYQFVLCALSVVVYGTRFPEVLAPGRFDIVGHSHQWFHILGSMATYHQLQGNIYDLQHRRSYLGSVLPMPTFASSAGLVLTVLAVNLLIIAGFTAFIWKTEHLREIKHKQGIPTTGSRSCNNNARDRKSKLSKKHYL